MSIPKSAPAWAALVAGVASVAAFNWCFVPPRHSWAVDLHQHAREHAREQGVRNALLAAIAHDYRTPTCPRPCRWPRSRACLCRCLKAPTS